MTMTLKQNGGVFGRHPTFSQTTVDGQFSADGDTLFVDAENRRVGFSTSTPEKLVEIREDVNASVSYPLFIRNESFGAGSGSGILFRNRAGSAFTEGTIEFIGTGANQSEFVVRVEGIPGSGPQIALKVDKDGNASLPAGNLIVSNGKGIDFSATAGTGTSELFDDYEEGTWTPTVTSGAGVVTVLSAASSTYTKIGRTVQVYASISMSTDASVGTSDLTIGGLPYASVGYGTGNLANSNFSSGDLGTGGAHGHVSVAGSNIRHLNRTISINSRASFTWAYYAIYTAS
jgi:hypothetical protein